MFNNVTVKSIFFSWIEPRIANMPDEFLERLAIAEFNDNIMKKHLQQRQKGTYKVLYIIVNGKFGCLSCAERKSDKKQVAIKSFTSQSIPFFFTELRAFLTLRNNSFIVNFLDAYQLPHRRYVIVLEFAPQSLRNFLKRSPLKNRISFSWMMKDLYNGCQELHRINVAHRDIKPDNLLVWTKNNVIKLCDFGLTTCTPKNMDKLRTMCGTPSYMAPELFLGKSYNGIGVDIWALGCVMFEFFSNVVAFSSLNLYTLKRIILQRRFQPDGWKKIPDWWKCTITMCFAKKEKRLNNESLLLTHSKEVFDTNTL